MHPEATLADIEIAMGELSGAHRLLSEAAAELNANRAKVLKDTAIKMLRNASSASQNAKRRAQEL